MEREKIKLWLPLILVALFSASCEKKEIPATPYDRGSAIENTLKLGENYSNQLYFNLKENRIVKQNSKMDWDFALSCEADPVIVLNTSRNMLAGITPHTQLEQVKDTVGIKLVMDFPSGNKDSLSIGRLNRFDKVFAVWMGYGLDGEDLGLMKIKFEAKSNGDVYFEYGKINDLSFKSGVLKPDDQYNHVFYSMINHQKADIEPLKTTYDLWFTQYLHFFLEPEITPYLVAGALLNPYQTAATKVIKNDFTEVSLSDTIQFPFSLNRDEIGYDWKKFSLSENTYTLAPNYNYIVKVQTGFYFRLKFTDFYDENGFRGAPSFVYIAL